MQFVIQGYSVSRGSYDAALLSLELPVDFFLTITAPIDVILDGDGRFLAPDDIGAFNVILGDDDQGPITEVEYRTFTREEDSETVSYSFAVLTREATADFILIPVDPATGVILEDVLPAASDYSAGDTFTPVAVGPFFNTAPVAVTTTGNTDEDVAGTFDVVATATDADDDTVTLVSVGDATNGTTEIVDGSIVYTPGDDFNGSDSFTYTISDGFETTEATFNVTVDPVNDDPVGEDDDAETDEDNAVTIDVLDNDTDVEDDILTVTAVGAAAFGTVQIVDNEVVYTPNADANGEDSFTYTVSDGELTDTATVTVTVNAVNDDPVADDDTATTDEDVAVSIDVLDGDTDVDGDTLSIASVGTASLGTVSIVAGEILYTPNADAFGTDTFTYTVTDGELEDEGSVTVTITEVPDDIGGGTGDETFDAGAGVETFNLGGGEDTISGPVQNFFGDTFNDFSNDDEIVFDEGIGRDRITVTEGSAIISIDTDGDGTSDGSFTLAGDFSGGDFMAVVGGSGTTLTFEDFLPVLADKQAIDPGLVNGIINQAFLTGNGTQDMQITLKDAGFAAKNNVVGAYEITDTGEIVDVQILFENANEDKTATTVLSGIEAGNKVGFFLIDNGAAWLAEQADTIVFSFLDGDGNAANVDDSAVVLAVDGVATDQEVYHSFAETLNSDGVQHALSGVDEGGQSLTVGFEDLLGGGDRDYEDVVFSIAFIDAPLV